ncbi:MAG TPA: peptidoglycan DD-metalloendopeptidase family protein [Balneolaceae bacterium]|nr:peptidoglycan DD-metalloendopeptidase family protein [Balneolaceae bacterium]
MRSLLVFGVILGVLLAGCESRKESDKADIPQAQKADTTVSPTIDAFGQVIDSMHVEEHHVKRNESFYQILTKYDFSPQQIYSITQKAKNVTNLHDLKPGQKYRIYASAKGEASIEKMIWQPNPVDYVVFDWNPDSLQIYKAARPITAKSAVASGEIDNSLFEAINREKKSPLLAYKMANVFAWEIDFYGLRKGDSFKTLYNKKYIDDNFYGIGKIKAAEFTYRGKTYRAYRFTHGNVDGYFNRDGKSVEKALLKMPFKYGHRITSHFSQHRMNPVLHKVMPHHGVDYAAPVGTPVLATGDGTVLEAHYGGASGNIIKIRHNSTYTTAYMHLHRFAHGIHAGATVKQGQIIGYVGTTGRSTGPHLDYRIFKNGRAVNPLTIELPSAESVPDSLMNAFTHVRDSLNRKMRNMLIEQQQDRLVVSQVAK